MPQMAMLNGTCISKRDLATLFMIDWEGFKPAVGKLLLSEPTLPDPNFARTVVFLVAVEETEGILGFVLNRKMELKLSDLGESFALLEHSLYEGGPVEPDTLHILHRMEGIEGAVRVAEGVYWGGEITQLLEKIPGSDVNDYRFYLGYSGWASGQLEREIEEKTWLLADATAAQIFFSDPALLWKETIQSLGGDIASLANYPMDPTWN
jgi:putative transcriptional regulator